MPTLDELLQEQNPSYVPLKPPVSLVDMKMSSVMDKLAQKQQEQGLDPYSQYSASKEGGYDSTNLIDLAQASVLRSSGNIADFAKGASNRIFDTDFDDSEATGYSNSLAADQATGVSNEYRQQLQQDQSLVGQNVADGDYWEAAKNSANVAFRTLADSAGTAVGLAAGTAATALTGGLAAPFLANRVTKVFKGAEGLKNRIENLKKGKEVKRLAAETDGIITKGIKGTPKAASNVSLLVADMTQQDINSYRKEHNEDPSNARVGTMMLGHFVTSTMQVAVIKSLIIPDVKKAIIDEGEILLAGIKGSSNIKQIGTRVITAAGKISAAAGGEAAQEYLQTWQSILTTKIGPEETDFLLQAIANEIADTKNQNEALTGAFLGAGAGGAAKVSTTGPAFAIGVTTDIAKGATKHVAKYAANKVDEQSYKLLSKEDRQRASTDYKRKSKIHNEFKAFNEANISIVKKANSIDDISNEAVINDISAIQNKLNLTTNQLKNPKTFKVVTDSLQRMYSSDIVKSRVSLDSSSAAGIAKQVAKNTSVLTKEAAIKASAIVKDKFGVDLEKAVVAAKVLGEAAVDTVKTFKSSAAAGVLERGINLTNDSSRSAVKELKTLVNEANVSDLKKNYRLLKDSNPIAANIINKAITAKNKVSNRVFGDNSSQVNESNIDSTISDIASGKVAIGESGLSPSVLHESIDNAVYSSIADVETSDIISKALSVLKKSSAVTNGSERVSRDIDILQRVLDNKRTKLKTRDQNTAQAEFDEGKSLKRKVVDKVYKAASNFVVNTSEKAGEKLSELYDTTADSIENWFDEAVKEKQVFVDSMVDAKLSADIKRHGPSIDRYMKGLNNLKDPQELINLVFKSNFASDLLNNFDFNNEDDLYNFINFYTNKSVKKSLEESKGSNDFKDSVLLAGKDFFDSRSNSVSSETEAAVKKDNELENKLNDNNELENSNNSSNSDNELELENKLNDNNQKFSDSSEKLNEQEARILADEFNIKVCT